MVLDAVIYHMSNIPLTGLPFLLFSRDVPLQTMLYPEIGVMLVLHLWEQWAWTVN